MLHTNAFQAVSHLDNLSAYGRLVDVFARIMPLTNRYDVLEAMKWSSHGPAAIGRILDEISAVQAQVVEIFTDPRLEVPALFARAESEAHSLDQWDRANLRCMRDIFDSVRPFFPARGQSARERIVAYESVLGRAEQGWMANYTLGMHDPAAAWAAQIPLLEQAIDAVRTARGPLARERGMKLSELCLQRFVPGMTNRDVDRMIADVRSTHPKLVADERAAQNRVPPPLPLPPHLPKAAQMELFQKIAGCILDAVGWDRATREKAGVSVRLVSEETGFCNGSPCEAIVAINVKEHNFFMGLSNCFHECGHLPTLLEANRISRADLRGQPVATFNGHGVHEASALLMEIMGRDARVFTLIKPMIDEVFPAHGIDTSGPEWSADNLWRLATRPDLETLEIEAPDVMYRPNMAWRSLAARRLLDGEMGVRDLPVFCAGAMRDFTGLDFDPNAFFVLDSHWFEGLESYFPAYMFGEAIAQRFRVRPTPAAGGTLTSYIKEGYAAFARNVTRNASLHVPASYLETLYLRDKDDTAQLLPQERPAIQPHGRAMPLVLA